VVRYFQSRELIVTLSDLAIVPGNRAAFLVEWLQWLMGVVMTSIDRIGFLDGHERNSKRGNGEQLWGIWGGRY
jgi:hypothetical protein